MNKMKIPKKYQHKVSSFEKLDDSFSNDGYEVNLNDNYEYEESGLHYVETYREALEVMREAYEVKKR